MPEENTEKEFDAGWKTAIAEVSGIDNDDPPRGAKPDPEVDTGTEPDDELAQGEEEVEDEPAPTPPRVDPNEQREQARRSLYGRIEAERKRIAKGEEAYRTQFGSLPWDKSPEELKKEAEVAEAIKRLATELPEVDRAIEGKIESRIRAIREELTGQVEGLNESQTASSRYTYITAVHPDYDEIRTPGTEMNDLLNEWVSHLPTRYGVRIFEIEQNGTPQEVAAVISAFKEDLSAVLAEESPVGDNEQTPPSGVRLGVVDEGVRAGPSGAPRGRPDPRNSDQGWADALREIKQGR